MVAAGREVIITQIEAAIVARLGITRHTSKHLYSRCGPWLYSVVRARGARRTRPGDPSAELSTGTASYININISSCSRSGTGEDGPLVDVGGMF
jgi:hypothetical protein